MHAEPRLLWAPRAWLVRRGRGAWHERVLLEIGADGCWSEVTPDTPPPSHALRLAGPALPGIVDAHSHAFQRAFAGLAERRDSDSDDFWSWRDRMYRVAQRIEPDALRAIAAQLFVELLQGGYTQVCEFHYLHHRPDGARYADPLAMSAALAEAAAGAGIGLTVLPVLYERAGFDAPTLRDDQRRFATTADSVLQLRDGIRALGTPNVGASVALHSLRAASAASIRRVLDAMADDGGPIHIHVSEQQREVDECLAATGQRPIAWLADQIGLDERWQLVHATHATAGEIESVARSGAGVVLCPTTEANLGDGITDVARWIDSDVPLALGSDSNVERAWWSELRCLEYGQRLTHQRRNVCARPARRSPSTAETLLDAVLRAGGSAAGHSRWGLEVGARADLVVLDANDPALAGLPAAHIVDAVTFSGPARPVRDVMVDGAWVLRDRQHRSGTAIQAAFTDVMQALWREQ